jgi:TolB-like protein
MAKQPGPRFQTMTEVRLALEQSVLDGGAAKAREPQHPSIAVLPFANMSGDKENEYFGDGLAEEIINALAHVPGLKVTARTSAFAFRGKEQDITTIAEALHVGTILEGSVRRAGNRIRVTAQLISAADGYHLWSERYDREIADVFAIQDDIARAISTALQMKLAPEPAPLRRHTPNLRAYEAYLKARHYWFQATPESTARVKEFLDRAVALDPEFGLAYSLLGGHYTMLANLGIRPAREVIPLARAAEHEALRVEPSLPEAHALLGVCAGTYDYNWQEADREWRVAMAREPVSCHVLFWYGNHYLLPMGRPLDAMEAMARGLDEDPINLLYRHHFAVCLRHAGRLEDAETELRKILELDENFPLAVGTLGAVCAQQGRFEEALTLSEQAFSLTPWANPIVGQLAGLLVRAGATSRAETLLERIRPGTACGAPAGMAVFHALCGEFDPAADWTERAIDERYPPLVSILGPLLRSSSRWPALARMMNLPEPPLRGGSERRE